jgi:hypothetical protein
MNNNQTNIPSKQSDNVYHIHSRTGDQIKHQDMNMNKLKDYVQSEGFHEGHEKDIPEKKDFMDQGTFNNIAGTLDQHLGGPIENQQVQAGVSGQKEENTVQHMLENAKEFLIEAKDAIVDKAVELVDSAKKLFNANNANSTNLSTNTAINDNTNIQNQGFSQNK